MKRTIFGEIAKTLEKTIASKDVTLKQLAKKAGISYSSLTPIFNGTRDFGVSKLIAIANALDCTPNYLLQGLFHHTNDKNEHWYAQTVSSNPGYIAAFVSEISVTYCMIYEIATKRTMTSVLQCSLGCGQGSNNFLDCIIASIQRLSKCFTTILNYKDIAVFASVQQYEGTANRRKIQKKGNHLFSKFIVESDAVTNYRAFFSHKNGICVTINDGNVITYSTDYGQNIIKLQGYGFPISDVAGNFWLGCEGIKHVINVKENMEPSSLLSDKILAAFNDDIIFLSECTMVDPGLTYSKVSSIIKELMHRHQKSYEIVKKSASLLLERIRLIDSICKTKLPIAITGDLSHIYEDFFLTDRVMKSKDRNNTILLNYSINCVKETLGITDK